jgi:TPR repeat protein
MKYILTFILALTVTACQMVKPSETKKAEVLEVDWQDLLIEKAQSGEPEAQYAMARLSCCSGDRMKNTVEWLCASAEADMPQAFFDLGRIYSQTYPADYLVSPSNTMALAFYNLAEKYGFDAPHVLHNYRHRAISNMTKQDIEYSKELANQWPKIPCGTHKKRWSLN